MDRARMHAYVHAYASWPRAMDSDHDNAIARALAILYDASSTQIIRERRARIFARILESASRPRIDPKYSYASAIRRRLDAWNSAIEF